MYTLRTKVACTLTCYLPIMTVICTNASLRKEILSNMTSLSKLLKHQEFQVIKHLDFDFDLIEVSEPEESVFLSFDGLS